MQAEFKESYRIRKQTYPMSKIPKLRKGFKQRLNQSFGYLTSGRWNLVRFPQKDKELLTTLRALPYNILFSSVQSLSHVWLFVTLWTAAHQVSLPITNSRTLLKLMSIELVMPSNHLILHHPILLLHSIFASIRVFSKEWVLRIKWPKYWSFSFSISPSNEYSGLISFRMDWLDLLSVQGTLKSLLQYHSWKASILWRSAFFIVQLLHLYMTTGKTIALTRQTFAGKVMSLLFNMLSQFSHSVMVDSLWSHEPQHASSPCPSPIPRVHPNSCPLNWWCHPTISSSVIPFSYCPQSFPASGSFQMSQLFASGGQSIGVSASPSVLPMNMLSRLVITFLPRSKCLLISWLQYTDAQKWWWWWWFSC